MRPAMAREPTQASKDSVRGPAQAVGCCAHGIRYVTQLCRPESDARLASLGDIDLGSLKRFRAKHAGTDPPMTYQVSYL